MFLFPAEETADLWFAALTREPDPAYWVFAWREGGWKLVAGALPLDGEAPDAAPTGIGPAETAAVQATLVPQSHLSYLTDPAGLTGISFPSGDPVRDLRDELRDRPARVRPDRLTADVDLSADEPARTLALADGGALVFHTVEITFRQRPRSGAKTPAHPIYGKRDLRAFTGTAKPSRITGTELLILATRVAVDGSLSTVASRRVVTDVTTG
ncbi:hypothetical protein [Thermocatellispora tengchongensis]|uniref:hypothetical protein n=1 Tax=Thermocatellispora tengchongensis TaxID=1073253 RepID=UPI003644AB09